MNLITWFYTKIFGRFVGSDELGNSYFERLVDKSSFFRNFHRQNRWIVYSTPWISGSYIPNGWFLWLHYQSNSPPSKEEIRIPERWEKSQKFDDARFLSSTVINHNIKKTYESWRPN